MRTVNHSELKELIKKYYSIKKSLFIWGTFGVGKSAVVKDTAKSMGVQCIDVRISQLEPSDLRGLPKLEGDNTRWLPPNWLPKEGKGILFFDEINLAPPSIQASCYQLILDRELGDYKLPEGWMVISCGNRIEDRANVFDLPAPLANRFGHIELRVPTVDDWTAWGMENGNRLDSRIMVFLQWKPSRIFTFDSKNRDKAIATPRSWELCSRLIQDVDDYDTIETLASTAIGEAIAIELVAFMRLQQKFNVKDILNNPEKVKEIKEIDLKYSLLSSLTEYYRAKMTPEHLQGCIRVALNMQVEFGSLLLRFIKGVDAVYWKKEIYKLPEVNEMATTLGKFVVE